MAFLHCHTKNCGWSQDDFWNKDGYTPFRKDLIETWQKDIFKDKVYADEWWFIDIGLAPQYDLVELIPEPEPPKITEIIDDKKRQKHEDCYHDGVQTHYRKYWVKGTCYVAALMERKARNIKNMLVRTYEEFKEKKDTLVCPRCGKQNWDID